jgi:hypothetical protein
MTLNKNLDHFLTKGKLMTICETPRLNNLFSLSQISCVAYNIGYILF